MKILKFVMFLFYKHYNKGINDRAPYFSALCATVFLICIHIFQLLIILNKVCLLQMKEDDFRIEKYGKLALLLLPLFLIIAYFVKPSQVKFLQYEDEKVRQGGTYLVVYIIMSITLLIVLILAFPKK